MEINIKDDPIFSYSPNHSGMIKLYLRYLDYGLLGCYNHLCNIIEVIRNGCALDLNDKIKNGELY